MLVSGLTLLTLFQRQYAFEAAFHCIDEAYRAKGPFLKHACHFRAERCDPVPKRLTLPDQIQLHTEGSKSLTSDSMDCRYKLLKRSLNLRGDIGPKSAVQTHLSLSTGSRPSQLEP